MLEIEYITIIEKKKRKAGIRIGKTEDPTKTGWKNNSAIYAKSRRRKFIRNCFVVRWITDNETIFKIHKEINKIHAQKFNVDLQNVLYDVTSTDLEGEQKYLRSLIQCRRQKDRQKQIIIGIVVSWDKGVPIYHFVDEGKQM